MDMPPDVRTYVYFLFICIKIISSQPASEVLAAEQCGFQFYVSLTQ